MSIRMQRFLFLFVWVALLSTTALRAEDPPQPGRVGVVALNSPTGVGENRIGILDPNTHRVYGPFLNDNSLGSQGGQVFDVVLTPDGLIAMVTNFGDASVHFIDLSSPLQPRVYASLDIGFFAEDMALSPDGQWLLVTDGGFSPVVAVIHVPSTRHVQNFNTSSLGSAQAVAIAPDGQTVLLADYFGGAVHVLLLDPQTGSLTPREALPINQYLQAQPTPIDFRPVNVVISPDGRTALAVNASPTGTSPDYTHGACPAVLRIDGPGEVSFTGVVSLPPAEAGGQSAVFSADGHFAYIHSSHYNTAAAEFVSPLVLELEVTGPGRMQRTGRKITLDRGKCSSQLFGVDTLSWAGNSGRFLYVSNMSLSGATHNISVVDLNWFEQVALMETPGLPTGLAFAPTAGGSGSDLAVGLSLSAASIPVDTELTATVTVSNPGPGTATNIVISSPVHRTWPLVTYQASHGAYEPGMHRWVIPSLPAGATATLTLTVTAPSAMTDVLEARLLSLDGVDPNASNNVGSAPITITAAGAL